MIIKFCSRLHNPFLSKTTIQLGTLYYYKSIDKDFIRDIDEGVVSRTFHPKPPVVFTGNEIGRLTGLSISGSGTIRFVGRAVKTTASIPNAYIFCTSQLTKPTPEYATSLGYDSWYVIKDANQLCNAMAYEIRQQVSPELDMSAFHGKVSYQENKEIVYSALSDFSLSHHIVEPQMYLLERQTSRQNPLKLYSVEQEYRFVFPLLGKDRKLISLPKKVIYLDSSVIMEFIEERAV